MFKKKETQQEQALTVQEQEQAGDKDTAYNAAVVRFQQACEDVKAKKSALYEEFQKARTLFMAGDPKQMRYENGDPFSTAAVDNAAMTTGDPVDEKKYVAYGHTIAMSVFRDDEFMAELVRVIQAVSGETSAEEKALYNDVLEAEKELEENTLRLTKKVSKARDALTLHRRKICQVLLYTE